MANIGNNIFDNLKQMRRPYVAPEMLVETFVEEGEMLAATPITGGDPNTGQNTDGGETPTFPPGVPSPGAKETDLFFDDNGLDW